MARLKELLDKFHIERMKGDFIFFDNLIKKRYESCMTWLNDGMFDPMNTIDMRDGEDTFTKAISVGHYAIIETLMERYDLTEHKRIGDAYRVLGCQKMLQQDLSGAKRLWIKALDYTDASSLRRPPDFDYRFMPKRYISITDDPEQLYLYMPPLSFASTAAVIDDLWEFTCEKCINQANDLDLYIQAILISDRILGPENSDTQELILYQDALVNKDINLDLRFKIILYCLRSIISRKKIGEVKVRDHLILRTYRMFLRAVQRECRDFDMNLLDYFIRLIIPSSKHFAKLCRIKGEDGRPMLVSNPIAVAPSYLYPYTTTKHRRIITPEQINADRHLESTRVDIAELMKLFAMTNTTVEISYSLVKLLILCGIPVMHRWLHKFGLRHNIIEVLAIRGYPIDYMNEFNLNLLEQINIEEDCDTEQRQFEFSTISLLSNMTNMRTIYNPMIFMDTSF